MKQIIIAFVLLNLVIGGLIYTGTVMIGGNPWQEWLSLELAQALGAMQAVLYWSIRRNK